MVVRKGTRQLIEESFAELLAQKSIRNITVSDIASNCGISDRTFYYHFHDKYELVGEVYVRLLSQALELWGDYEAVLRKSAEIVDVFSDYVVRAMEVVSGVEAPIDRMARRSSPSPEDGGRGQQGERRIFDMVSSTDKYYAEYPGNVHCVEDKRDTCSCELADWMCKRMLAQ